jgi:ketosteroid isomerase-like protein
MGDASAQRLQDAKEIVDVMNAYTTALDTQDWDLLASCFTPDGDADFGNIAGVGALDTPQAVVDLCRGALQNLQATQHLQGNYVVEVDGDSATASCYLQANHFFEGAPGGSVFTVWGKYTDRFVRTDDGWKIKHRDLRSISAGGNMNLFNEAAEVAGQAAPTPG